MITVTNICSKIILIKKELCSNFEIPPRSFGQPILLISDSAAIVFQKENKADVAITKIEGRSRIKLLLSNVLKSIDKSMYYTGK